MYNMTDEWITSQITQFVLNKNGFDEIDAMQTLYNIDSLPAFLSGGRKLIDQYLFGNVTSLSLNAFLYGYNDQYIVHAFDERPFLAGKEVDLEPFISPILTDEQRMNEQKGIYPGTIDLDRVASIRFINQKHYINKNVPIKNGNG